MQPSVDQEFPTYAALSRYLNEPPKGGTAKILQREHWQRYFLWERHGARGYKITQILRPYCPRTPVRTKWKELITPLIEHYFAVADSGIGPNIQSACRKQLIVSTSELYSLFGMANRNIQRLAEGTLPISIDEEKQREWYYKIRLIFKDIMRRTLAVYEGEPQWTIHDPSNGWRRIIEKEEEGEINKIVNSTLDELGLKSIPEMIGSRREHIFYKLLRVNIFNRFGFDGIHRVYIYPRYFGKILSAEKLAELRSQFNSRILLYLEAREVPSYLLDIILPIEN